MLRFAAMPGESSLRDVIRNLLQYGDLPFLDFVELALHHPELGYYSRALNPIGKAGDFITSPTLSPVFAFALARLVEELVDRHEGAVCSVVDVGCGDGTLIHSLYEVSSPRVRKQARFFGVDRSLARVTDSVLGERALTFVRSLGEVTKGDGQLVISNELFDAIPFARVVRRGEELHELWIGENEGELDWTEHEAAAPLQDYFAARGIELADGQFADISPEWSAFYGDMARFVTRGLIVTFDYGFPAKQLFDPRIRRFGTAAAYSQQRVTRDLLANAGEQDLTAHINFDDLIAAGEREGMATLFFDRQAKFLLSLGITEHPLFQPVLELEISSAEEGVALLDRRDEARRLVLPDGIGEDIRVLVQERGVTQTPWSFQRKLY